MGNRAVITTAPFKASNIGIYVHWNGGQESIEGFLQAAKALRFRSPSADNYGWAHLAQIIANFFGSDGLCVGVNKCSNLDCNNSDNGVWLIDGWDLVGNTSGATSGRVRKVGPNPDPGKTEVIKNACIASIVGDTATLYAQLRRILPLAETCAEKHGDTELGEACTGARYWFAKVKESVDEFNAFPDEEQAEPASA